MNAGLSSRCILSIAAVAPISLTIEQIELHASDAHEPSKVTAAGLLATALESSQQLSSESTEIAMTMLTALLNDKSGIVFEAGDIGADLAALLAGTYAAPAAPKSGEEEVKPAKEKSLARRPPPVGPQPSRATKERPAR